MGLDSLNELRKAIDEKDRAIVKLFCERMATAAEIAKYKKENGRAVYDPVREREKLTSVEKMAGDEMGNYTKQLYSLMFDLSRSYQNRLITAEKTVLYRRILKAIDETPKLFPKSPTVACQGTEGAYSTIAAEKFFSSPSIEYVKTFSDVVHAVDTGYVKYGILPIENSTAGEVSAVYSLLENNDVFITRETRVKIDHNLLVNPGVLLSDVKEIISHEQAINQCRKFIDSLGREIKITFAANTAVAAKYVKDSERKDIAALSSIRCASLYGLDPIARDVQNSDNNHTRFICISKDIEIYPGSDRTRIIIVTSNTPGALFKVLSKFNALGINLTSLMAKPIEGRDFEFKFFLEFDTSIYSEEFADLMQTLDDSCDKFKYLGSYREII